MINYEKKSKILKTNLCKQVNKIDRIHFLKDARGIVEDASFNEDFEELMLMMEQGYSEEDIKEARRINNASYHRVKRLRERIEKYLQCGRCVFATLSFTDDVLNSTTKQTRRKYVSRFLKSVSDYYVANIDYGKENGREHYHAVIVIDNIKRGSWPYGYDKYKKVRCDNLSSIKLSKYVSKLTNHAIKETTHANYMIYSRYNESETISLRG